MGGAVFCAGIQLADSSMVVPRGPPATISSGAEYNSRPNYETQNHYKLSNKLSTGRDCTVLHFYRIR